MRSGDGDPALCRPHKIAFAEQGRRAAPAHQPRSSVADLFDDFISGRPFDSSKVARAVNEFAWGMGGGYGNYSPDIDTGEAPRSRFDPPSGFQPPRSWFREEPPVRPLVDESLLRERMRARIALGFGPSDPLTDDTIKDRRRQLARRHHPDLKGGSSEKMKTINDAADVLLESLEKT
jgi:hypothetical protein